MSLNHLETPAGSVSLLVAVFFSGAACTGRQHEANASRERTSEASLAAQGDVPVLEAAAREVLGVPPAKAPIHPTGRFDVRVWGSAANTHTLLDREGRGAVPVSEARFLWGAGQIYVFFYAGDLDLQVRASQHDAPVWKDDSVVLSFFSSDGRKRVIQISPKGVVADGLCPEDAADLGDSRCDMSWESGVRAAADYDGTINKLGDFDEEWVVEAAIPLASLSLMDAGAGTGVPFRLSRCEVAYDGVRACGAWGRGPGGGLLVLENR